MDALGVAPGKDHRRARAGALAQEVDAVVAEGRARGFEVVDPLREPVAGEVDALVGEPIGARPEGVAVCTEGFLAPRKSAER
jgi:hypothetical protein